MTLTGCFASKAPDGGEVSLHQVVRTQRAWPQINVNISLFANNILAIATFSKKCLLYHIFYGFYALSASTKPPWRLHCIICNFPFDCCDHLNQDYFLQDIKMLFDKIYPINKKRQSLEMFSKLMQQVSSRNYSRKETKFKALTVSNCWCWCFIRSPSRCWSDDFIHSRCFFKDSRFVSNTETKTIKGKVKPMKSKISLKLQMENCDYIP